MPSIERVSLFLERLDDWWGCLAQGLSAEDAEVPGPDQRTSGRPGSDGFATRPGESLGRTPRKGVGAASSFVIYSPASCRAA